MNRAVRIKARDVAITVVVTATLMILLKHGIKKAPKVPDQWAEYF